MYTKTIWFSGGSFYELEAVFTKIKGVTAVTAGYINSEQDAPSHEDIVSGKVKAVMGIEVKFNPKKIDLSSLMDVLFTVVNPYVLDQSEETKGEMYGSGVYSSSGEDEVIIEYYFNFLRNRQKTPAVTEDEITLNDPNSKKVGIRRLFATATRLKSFIPAADEHQGYLEKHLGTKTHIDFKRLQELNIIP